MPPPLQHLKNRSVLKLKQPGKAVVIFHKTVTTQWLTFFLLFLFPAKTVPWVDHVAWVFLCPPKLQIFILWKFTAHLLLALHFVPVWTATERTGPPSPGAFIPAGLSPRLPSAWRRGPGSQAAEPAWAHVPAVGGLPVDPIPAGLKVSSHVYEAMLSPLSAVAGSLEVIFQQDDGAGTVCALA